MSSNLTLTVTKMDFVLQNQFYILLGLMVLGFFVVWKFVADLNQKTDKLLGGNSSEDIKKNLLQRLAKAEAKLEEIEPRLRLTEEISQISVQKVGFTRFNPFQDTGGDNSFILALLDRENNGVLITSLYMRENMRVYAKRVERGATKQQLSEEEEKVLREALNKN